MAKNNSNFGEDDGEILFYVSCYSSSYFSSRSQKIVNLSNNSTDDKVLLREGASGCQKVLLQEGVSSSEDFFSLKRKRQELKEAGVLLAPIIPVFPTVGSPVTVP